MSRVIQSISTPSTGLLEASGLTDVTGVGADNTTLITINDDAVLEQWRNLGVPRHQVKADGRVWFSVLGASPSTPVNGDLWLELDGMLGTVLRFYDGTTIFTLTTVPPAGTLSLTASTALLTGMALRATAGGAAYATTANYHIIGLAKQDTLIGDPIEVLTVGDIYNSADFTLLTGTVTLTVGSIYWLSAVAGKWQTSPNATVAAKIGIAVSTTQLLIQPDLAVVF